MEVALHRLLLVEPGLRHDVLSGFDYWLNQRKDTNPAKREQYERWDAIRSGSPEAQRVSVSAVPKGHEGSAVLIPSRLAPAVIRSS